VSAPLAECLTGFIVMIRHSLRRLTKVRTAILSGQDCTLEASYRELLALREQVRNAELAAAKYREPRSSRANGKKPRGRNDDMRP
jgi:hypothetical protein